MARYVLLEFDSDDTADAFCSKIDAQTESGKHFRLAGIFYKPTRWCECPHPEGYHKNQIAQGAKYGLWTCIVCRRPRMGTHNPTNLLSLDKLHLTDDKYTMRVADLTFFEVPTKNLKRHRD